MTILPETHPIFVNKGLVSAEMLAFLQKFKLKSKQILFIIRLDQLAIRK